MLDPRWKGKVLIREPLASGTMRAIFGMICSPIDPGDGQPRPGLRVAPPPRCADKEYVVNPTLLLEKLARREGLLTMWDLPDVLLERRRGLPLTLRLPAERVSGDRRLGRPSCGVRGIPARRGS